MNEMQGYVWIGLLLVRHSQDAGRAKGMCHPSSALIKSQDVTAGIKNAF